jgi:ribosomal protein L17
MSLFQNYKQRQEALLKMISSLKDFEGSDKSVGYVFAVAREILSKPTDFQNVQWLIRKGSELIAYYAYLEGTANVHNAKSQVSEVAHNDVKAGMMIALTSEDVSTTTARAQASQATVDSEVDVIKEELLAKNYATAAKVADRMVSFIQSTLRNKESEMNRGKLTDQGLPK